MVNSQLQSGENSNRVNTSSLHLKLYRLEHLVEMNLGVTGSQRRRQTLVCSLETEQSTEGSCSRSGA